MNFSGIPTHWEIKKMTDVVKWGSGGTPKTTEKTYYENGNIPWLIIGDLNDGIVTSSASCITELGLRNSSAKMIPTGTLLVAMYGSIGKLGITGIECCTNQAIAYAKELYGVTTKYMFYFMAMIKPDLIAMGKGGTQKNISQTVLNSLDVPVPSLEEQECIVTRIEELFSQLDKGVETLQKTKQQLAIYRQAVLNSAFEGYKEWPRYTFNEILSEMRNGYGQKPDDEGEYRLLRISSVRAMNVDLHDYRLNKTAFDDKDIIRPYDLLFTRYNGSVDYVGVCAYVKQHEGVYAYPDKIIKCRLKEPSELLAKYIQYYMSQGEARRFIRSRIKTTSGQNGIAGSDIKKVTVHIPESKRIERIIEEIEERMSACDNIEVTVQKVLQQVEAMRQSILKQAFEGRI